MIWKKKLLNKLFNNPKVKNSVINNLKMYLRKTYILQIIITTNKLNAEILLVFNLSICWKELNKYPKTL